MFICSFHSEQAWTRWANKSENDVSHIADDVKCCLRRIAHASSKEELDKSIKGFLSWEHFTGKLKVWFTKKWLPDIKRWAVYFRLNQPMLTNTNNGTERLSCELKTEELVDYKKCSLSEILKVVIESFLPSLYHRFVEINIRYSDEYKKYQRPLPTYLRNCPKNIIDHLSMRKGAADHAMIRPVEPINSTCCSVKSSDLTELKKKEYIVHFGNEQRYCSCTRPDFKNNRMIFKHFFVVIKGNHRTTIFLYYLGLMFGSIWIASFLLRQV